jgi:protein O-mannosyl-transferase
MPRTSSRVFPWLAGALLALAALAAYRNSFTGPFIFDDTQSILENPTLRHLSSALAPPAGGLTVSGRPLVNLSLGLNYAAGGLRVGGYHAVNLAIHLLAALALFGVVRRTLRRRPVADENGTGSGPDSALLLAFSVALLWTVHPLQTESVSYVVQRAESLMGLCYFLTLYCFIRHAESARVGARRTWAVLSVLSCFAGAASKEVMVSAPLLVFLYDRTFLSGSFAAAWRRHGRLHGSLATSWLFLGGLVLGTGERGGTSGFGLGVAWWTYAQTQFRAVVIYLRLAVWPHPLVFDYGTEWAKSPAEFVPYALAVAVLAGGTLWALRRRPALGFLGAWFFCILAPTSFVTGTRQTMAEHRMYLPLAAVLVLAVLALWRAAGRAALAVVLVLAILLGVATARRNEDYRSKVIMYRDVVAKRPENRWGRYDLASAFSEAGDPAEAERGYREALRLDPNFPEAHNNLGGILLQKNQLAAARDQFAAAVTLRPTYAEARYNLGLVLIELGRPAEAAEEEEQALLLNPSLARAHFGLALAQEAEGLNAAAVAHFVRSIQLAPEFAPAHYKLANALARQGRLADAVVQYEAAIRLDPGMADAHDDLGNTLMRQRRLVAALAQYEVAERLQPRNAGIHYNLGSALAQLGLAAKAEPEFQEALRLRPDFPVARAALAHLHAADRGPGAL